jgi:hypothetical protein
MNIELFEKAIIKDDDYVFVKPICDLFDLNYQSQMRIIRNDHFLSKYWIKKSNTLLFGDNYERYALQKRAIIRWIQLINPKIVHQNLQDDFINFQYSIFDFMFSKIIDEENHRKTYLRLHKMKTLYGKIGREIQNLEKQQKIFLEAKYGIQKQLDLN